MQVQFNDGTMPSRAMGRYQFELRPGANVIQVQTMGADGLSAQTYCWVVYRQGPLDAPAAAQACKPGKGPKPGAGGR